MLRPLWKHQPKYTLGPPRGSITPNVCNTFRAVRLRLLVIKRNVVALIGEVLGAPVFRGRLVMDSLDRRVPHL